MARKLEKLQLQLDKVEAEISSLQQFRRTPQQDRFRRFLYGERRFLLRQIQKMQAPADARKDNEQAAIEANKKRSEKMKRTWRYIRTIQENYFPEKSAKEIRSLFKKHRQGLESGVSDVVWANPSP